MVKPRDGWKLKLAAMLTNESCPPLNESTGEPPTAVMLVRTWRRGVVTRWPERPSFSKHYPPTSLKCGQSNNKDPSNHYSWWKDHSPSLLSHTPQDLHSYPPPLLSSLPSTPSLPPPPFFPVSSVCILATPDSEVVLYRLVPLSHK